MAIVQISRITQRKGLQADLPQLAGGEFGWSTDTRQLYIGNGTLEEGAPTIGHTQILTEFSNVLIANGNISVDSIHASGTIHAVGLISSDTGLTAPTVTPTGNLVLGAYTVQASVSNTVPGNTVVSVASINGATTPAFNLNYEITCNNAVRIGTLQVTGITSAGSSLTVTNDYTDNGPLGSFGVELEVSQSSAGDPIVVSANVTSLSSATIKYSVNYFR